MSRRAVPYGAEDEAALLGAALLTKDAADLLVAHTTDADFWVPLHRRIRNAVVTLVNEGQAVDPATVASDLTRRNGVAGAGRGGGEDAKRAIMGLQADCPAAAHAPAYLRSVRDWTRRRRAIALADEIRQAAENGDPFGALVARVEGLVAEEKLDRTTWHELDLSPVLAGDFAEDRPSILVRADGACLIYPAKLHTFTGEPESGKSFLALHACAEQMGCGRHVVYVDFEDSPASVTARLLALGATTERLLERFHYVRPAEPLGAEGRHALGELVGRCRPVLLVVDGVTEALTLHGLSLESNRDIAAFLELLPRFVTRQGVATLLIDHVRKDKEQRGRWAIGGQHKLAAVDGAAYGLEVIRPVVRNGDGLVRMTIAKDRPGHVRSTSTGRVAAEMSTTSTEDSVLVELRCPEPASEEPGQWRPTELMERASRWLEMNPGASGRDVRDAIRGKEKWKLEALRALTAGGHVAVESGQRRSLCYRVVKPFRARSEEE